MPSNGLHVSPPSTDEHNEIGVVLCGILRAAAPPGWRAIPELGVRLPGANVIPDLVVLRPGAARNVTWREPGDVALAVEIESTSSIPVDRRRKPDLYAGAGIAAYWRIERHPAGPQLYAYELVGRAYRHIAWVRPGVAWQATSPYQVTLEPAKWGGT